LDDGVVHEQYFGFQTHLNGAVIRTSDGAPRRVDRTGDGTVYQDSASLGGPAITSLPLQHGALATAGEVLTHVKSVITSIRLGEPQGGGEVGLRVPDAVEAGLPWTLRLTGADSPARIRCAVYDAVSGRCVAAPRLQWRDGVIAARVTVRGSGLYRVRVDAGGPDPVTQLVLVTRPDDGTDD
jgi:hypothetical protein